VDGGGKPSDTINEFFLDLSRMSGTGNGIGAATIARLKTFATDYKSGCVTYIMRET